MGNNDELRPQCELLVCQGQGLDDPIQVRLEGETVWLSQRLMAEIYCVGIPTINEHISNIYEDEELLPEATIRKFRIVQTERPMSAAMPRWSLPTSKYDRFAEKRRIAAQQQAEQHYIDDLKKTAETLKRQRKKGKRK